jgi:conjugative transfer signal peptidase TraF
MSQSVLLALGAITIALFLTAAIAIAAFSDEDTLRATKVLVVGGAVAAAAVTIENAHLRVNFTASMPLGIYQLKPVPPGGIARGMTIAACPPLEAARLGRSRGYLDPGPCLGGSEPLLKLVAGVPGDRIDVSTAGISVDGCRLPDSASVAADAAGRRLGAWARGRYRLSAGRVWLYAPNPRMGFPLLGAGAHVLRPGRSGSAPHGPRGVPLYDRRAGLRCGALRWPRILARLEIARGGVRA